MAGSVGHCNACNAPLTLNLAPVERVAHALKKLDTQLAKKAKYQEVLEENQEDLFTDTGLISFFGTKAL